MTGRNTVVRSLHDIGLAAWFGGTLMGAVGLNGGSAKAKNPAEHLRLSSTGWAKWAPVQIAAILAHGIGGVGLILGNKGRLASKPESRTNTIVKLALTAVAAATTLYAGILGAKISAHADEVGEGATEPTEESASPALISAQRQQKVLQWVIPAVTAVLIVLGAQQGEQQRPIAGWFSRLTHRSR